MNLVKQVSQNIGRTIITPLISVNKNGVIRLNRPAVEQLSLSSGNKINMYQDKDSLKDWFLKIEDDGLVLRSKESYGKGLITQSSSIARDMIKSLKFEFRFSSLIAKEPLNFNKTVGFYAILTNSAKGK